MEKINMLFTKKSKVSMMSRGYTAFTLAEVLITLGIIGVIAALTIPNLIKNYQKTQTEVGTKKIYTTMTQYFQQATNEEGLPASWDWGTVSGSPNTIRFVQQYVTPYFKISQDCGYSYTDACWNQKKGLNNSEPWPGGYHFVLTDGTAFSIGMEDGLNMLDISIDFNGNKGPNIYGKDCFFMVIIKNEKNIKFWGTPFYGDREDRKTNTQYGCSSAGNGMYCGALMQYDGWQIKDDYGAY